MELHLWLSLATICLLGAISPGPSLALVINNTLSGGRYQGFASALSHGLGVAIYATLTIFCMATIITANPILFNAIQYAGAAFLVYLGLKALMAQGAKQALEQKDVKQFATNTHAQINGWRDGFLIAFFNPKLAIFFLALFSQFISPTANMIEKGIMISTVFTIDTLWYCLICFLLSKENIYPKLQAKQSAINFIMGIILILLAIRVIWL